MIHLQLIAISKFHSFFWGVGGSWPVGRGTQLLPRGGDGVDAVGRGTRVSGELQLLPGAVTGERGRLGYACGVGVAGGLRRRHRLIAVARRGGIADGS